METCNGWEEKSSTFVFLRMFAYKRPSGIVPSGNGVGCARQALLAP